MKRKKLGFTLIELLAVIVVIVVVLAITIPIISNMIETVRKEAFKATAYSISDSGRLLMANDTNIGYEEFYYLDGAQYNADGKKLDYTGDGPKTGVVILNENKKVAMAIHNGTYCATKSANTNKVTISKISAEECNAYNIINTCDTWEQIALKYDVTLADLLKANNVTDSNSSTCGLNIKIPLSSTSSNSNTAGGKTVYYKTYYSVGYTTYSENFTSTSYEYTIKLGVLPLNIADIEVVRATAKSVFESLDDFKRYITKKNMGEVVWPGDINPAEIDIDQASVFKDHALRSDNMTADDVTVMCDETECTATISITVDNMNNVNPNYINSNPIAYIPVKFTVEFNGEADMCTVRTTTDVVPGTLAGTGTNVDPYLVESIEDLVALSNNVNAGNTYSGKYISFNNSFNFANKRSYKDYTTTVYGDINGNGTVEGLLTELTTGAGFNPIGNNTTTFGGIILGNSTCIYDLYINRPTTSYVGFVGYNNGGTINTLNLIDVNIVGLDQTGGIAGYTYNGTIVDNVVKGDIKGNNNVGMAVGYFYSKSSSPQVTSIVAEGNVIGANNVGGLVGYTYTYYDDSQCYVRGLYKGGSIVSTGTSVGRILGKTEARYSSYARVSALSLASVTVNGTTISSNSQTSNHGASIDTLSSLKDLNLVEVALDTHIGGDNDGNGYYWYGDISGNLVHQKVNEYPIVFTLSGAGTSASPYLVNNYEELLQAQLNLGAVYQLASNIDMKDKSNFMLGSYVNTFRGTLLGNNKTISNYTLNLPQISYVGFLGVNTGTISNLTFNNTDITGGNYASAIGGTNSGTINDLTFNTLDVNGAHYTGGITGYNTGTIKVITLNNLNVTGQDQTGGSVGYTRNGYIAENIINGNVTGNNNVGLATGYMYSTSNSTQVVGIIASGNVVGGANVGGLVGYTYTYYDDSQCYVRGIYKSGSVKATGSVGRILGKTEARYSSYAQISALAVSSITVNGSTISSISQTSNHGANINSLSELSDINLVEVALDTHIGGDNDSNGYYWYGDTNGNLIRQSTTEYSIVFGLAGSGTVADPYLVGSYDDLVEAQMKLSSVYQITTNIDMAGKSNFMLGSYLNPFRGTLLGNNKVISNYTLNLPQISYVGFFGTNVGTISNLNFNNTDITGGNYASAIGGTNSGTINDLTFNTLDVNGAHYTGGITGYNTGTIKVITLNNINITGQDQTGGSVGYTRNGYIAENIINGSVTGNNNVGLATGYMYSTSPSTQVIGIIASGDVIGANNVGGLVGYTYTYYDDSQCYIRGIYKSGNVISTGTSVGRILGKTEARYSSYAQISSLAVSNVLVNGATITNNSQTSSHGANINSLSALSDINLVEVALDTHIGGDNDSNGYYWYGDTYGNLIRQSTTEYSIIFGLTGAGTVADPYLISSYDDLVEAQMKLSSVYKLTTNIDMNGKPNFMLGSYLNPFRGTLLGNNQSISNYTLNLPQISYVGFLGTNGGTISNLIFNNLDIDGGNYTAAISGSNSGTIDDLTLNVADINASHYAGGIIGYNSGTIKGLTINNVNVVGKDHTGGITGYMRNGAVIDSTVNGNVTGNNNVSLAVGNFYSNTTAPKIANVIVEGNVIGANNVGGLVGYTYTYYSDSQCYVKGINRGGSVKATVASAGRILGKTEARYSGYARITAASLSTVTVNDAIVTSASNTSSHGLDIASSDLSLDATYTNLGFNFTDETLDYIWYIDSGVAKFRQGSL